MKCCALTCIFLIWGLGLSSLLADSRVFPEGTQPDDRRLEALKDLNGHFPFAVPKSKSAWEERAESLRRRVLIATGLWPMPERTPMNPVVHGKVRRDGFTVEKVYFESLPGYYVTGLLFRPENSEGRQPAVLCPHGHGGRLQDHGEQGIRRHIVEGAERFEDSGRFPKVARCAQLARMGCVTFLFDMIGYADSRQLSDELVHRFATQRPEADTLESWGFFSTQAELRLQSVLGLQTWNAIRALDFLESLPDVDPERIGVTGGSGGGTQTILLGAIDSRPVVAFPQGMVSTSMQGGCTCENASLLRIGTGNVELAGLFAPKPQAMTAANDWTKAMMTDGFPELQQLYQLYGSKDAVGCKDLTHFPHNYNYVTRAVMYQWFNKHLQLGLDEPIVEEDFRPLTPEEHAVWNAAHPEPAGGDDFERSLTKQMAEASDKQLAALLPSDAESLKTYRRTVGSAWQTVIGRDVPGGNVVQEHVRQEERDGVRLSFGKVRLRDRGEELPVVVLLSQEKMPDDFVLWIHGKGKSALLGEEDSLAPELISLLEADRAVVLVDLFGQGEFLTGDSKIMKRNRTVENPREFAGYTYGYNDPLFAQRVHDILTMIGVMAPNAESLTIAGTNGAGPWVAAACAVAGEAVDRVAVDTEGFRFVQLEDYRDANFLPGAVKYGDLPALLALCAPRPLWLAGEATTPDVVSRVYGASGSQGQIHLAEESSVEAMVRWISE